MILNCILVAAGFTSGLAVLKLASIREYKLYKAGGSRVILLFVLTQHIK